MLRAMILIVLSLVLMVVILTQVVLPMFVDKLSFFWYFKKGGRDDIIIPVQEEPEVQDDLNTKAYEAKKSFVEVKKEIRSRKKKLDKLDRDTDV